MKFKLFPLVFLISLFLTAPNFGCAQYCIRTYDLKKQRQLGYLGVEIQDVNKKLKENKNLTVDKGVYIKKVIKHSPADEAGLLKGDVVVKYDDRVIEDSQDLTDAVRKTKPKTEVKIEIVREGESKIIPVVIGKLKNAKAFRFRYGPGWFISPKIPKIPHKFNIQIFTEGRTYGLRLQNLTKQLGKYFGSPDGKGVLVSEVEENSVAEKAGFKAGDVIVRINDHPIHNVDDVVDELYENEEEAPCEIIRDGKPMKLILKIESDDNDEDESDDMSIYMIPNDSYMKSFDFLKKDFDSEELKEQLLDLRNRIQNYIEKINKNIDYPIIDV
jgi:predicted metalloprotease with PDZ domain